MLYNQIKSNKRKTILVVTLYFILFLLVGAGAGYYLMHDPIIGTIAATAFGAIYILIMIRQSTDVVMSMNNATPINEDTDCMLKNVVEDMAMVANVPVPKIYIIESDGCNAFATGPSPKNAAVAVTRGLLNTLNREELEAVIAHEMAHIRNYDIRLQTIAVALGAVISIIVQLTLRSRSNNNNNQAASAFAIVGLLLSLIIAPMINLAISRQREYQADATAVRLTRNPLGLISALEKISDNSVVEDAPNDSKGMYIANPLESEWFSTHPKMEKRIEKLKKM